MPVHDWTLVDAGLFHAFHQDWISTLCRARLNAGVLPSDHFALREQSIQGPIPDVLTLRVAPVPDAPTLDPGGIAVATDPPRVRLVTQAEESLYV